MGVTTTWDRNHDNAKEILNETRRKLKESVEALAKLTDPDVYGYDEIKPEVITRFEEAQTQLLGIQIAISRIAKLL